MTSAEVSETCVHSNVESNNWHCLENMKKKTKDRNAGLLHKFNIFKLDSYTCSAFYIKSNKNIIFQHKSKEM